MTSFLNPKKSTIFQSHHTTSPLFVLVLVLVLVLIRDTCSTRKTRKGQGRERRKKLFLMQQSRQMVSEKGTDWKAYEKLIKIK